MTELDLTQVRVGDRIVFRAATREGNAKAMRVVTSVPTPSAPWFQVKAYQGWSDFYVRPSEILEHHPRETA